MRHVLGTLPPGVPVRRKIVVVLATAFAGCWSAQALADNPAEAMELPTIEVIGTTPLPGLGTPIRDVAGNVQVFTRKDLATQRQGNLAEFLEQNPTSVTVNSSQGNPFQPDISFRGFTASPLLGLPQGLSVFQDGVRINEAFGDVVNWDLLPQSAISSIQLIPGSNPIFGLNTLGGALAIYTKSGAQNPGGAVEVSAGSFGRKTVEFEQGGKFGAGGNLDYFFTGNYSKDNGWADHNPSKVQQFFGKVGYQTSTTDLDISLSAADNSLQGTQALPMSFSNNIRQAYTYPDSNQNQLGFLTVKGSHFINDKVLISGNLYYRHYKNSGFSSNVNGDGDQADAAAGPVDMAQATNNRSEIDQAGYGLGLQMTLLGQLAGKKNQFVMGASGDFGDARFTQANQDAEFTPDRGTVATGDFHQATDAKTRNSYYGIFFSDALSMTDRWTLTLSGRYNLARISIADQTGESPKLNGDHQFSRFNPAIGVNYNPTSKLTIYGSYSEGMRTPTPVELTCADPDAPCQLPNNFIADPALKKVVSRTLELGTRGKFGEESQWSAALYRTDLDDDIQFISSNGIATNAGYFQNVGKTRRQGLELSASTRFGALGVSAHYSFIDATFQSPFAESSPNNSTADANGVIQVKPGNQIPGIPRHSFKLRLDYDISEKWSIGANGILNSAIFARGDENNSDTQGKVPGYGVVNLDTRYKISHDLEFFARVNNLLNKQYANFGILGQNYFNGPNQSYDAVNPTIEQFRGYGAPRGIWLGLRYSWK
ncbi:Outer membrane receptor proteins, mostly Fe transport [Collimonas sp. OK307]|uniref:TonB-dependent receptor n=1 Tax=Collimonas sp. OK307 TaxID=1801620 RepID=UPI0008E18B23|nr:TonB-dependent receptor [Collimonas sp. OK307]SFH67607.1 Outer membrane receptor proteins, mostly Fe transport [Collimonas sp. OK307]